MQEGLVAQGRLVSEYARRQVPDCDHGQRVGAAIQTRATHKDLQVVAVGLMLVGLHQEIDPDREQRDSLGRGGLAQATQVADALAASVIDQLYLVLEAAAPALHQSRHVLQSQHSSDP